MILVCKGEKWVVCCRQPRIPIGRSDYLEVPAGMLDDSGHFAGVAAKVSTEKSLYDFTQKIFGVHTVSIGPEYFFLGTVINKYAGNLE